MKRISLCAALVFSMIGGSAYADYQEDYVVPLAGGGEDEVTPLEPINPADDPAVQKFILQERLFAEAMQEARTNPALAGYTTYLVYRFRLYEINRTAETKIAARVSPAVLPAMAGIVDKLTTQAGGRITVTVTHKEFRNDGSLMTEDIWSFEMDGAWKAQLDMKEATGKYHR